LLLIKFYLYTPIIMSDKYIPANPSVADDPFVYRSYKVSVNFGLLFYELTTKSHRIRKGPLVYLPRLWYTLLTLLFGFWGVGVLRKFRGIRNSIQAIHLNLSGGEDVTRLTIASHYDNRTRYVFNNLGRPSSAALSIETVDILLEIQDLFCGDVAAVPYADENATFLLMRLKEIRETGFTRRDMDSFFDAVILYATYEAER